jgi:hypothetical protein
MAEPILRDPVVSMPSQAGTPRTARVSTGATQQFIERLQRRWEELKDRVASPTAMPPSLIRELRDDIGYVGARARYYHENRPLQALGMIAGTAFALGLLVGLLRRR